MSQAFDDLEDEVDDLSDTSDTQGEELDDHESRIGDVEDTTSDIDPTRINQLNNPLDQDSIDLINGVVPNGTVTLSSGIGIINDQRIGSNTLLIYSTKTAAGVAHIGVGDPQLQYSYSISGSTITINSTSVSDASTIVYQLITAQ